MSNHTKAHLKMDTNKLCPICGEAHVMPHVDPVWQS